MKKRLNQKGFTLVELLAVLVILIAIMGIAIPTISSSLERTKANQNKARYKVLETAAEMYVTDNKNNIYENLGDYTSCYIELSSLEKYLPDDATKDADNNDMSGVVLYTRPNKYVYKKKNEVSAVACAVEIPENEPIKSTELESAKVEKGYQFTLATWYEYDKDSNMFKLTGNVGQMSLNEWIYNWYNGSNHENKYTCNIYGAPNGTSQDEECEILYEIFRFNGDVLEYYTYTTK